MDEKETVSMRLYDDDRTAIKLMAVERGITMPDMVAELVSNAHPPNLADVEAMLAGVAKRLDTVELDVSILLDKDFVLSAVSLAAMVNGKQVRQHAERLDWAIDKLQAAAEAARENS